MGFGVDEDEDDSVEGEPFVTDEEAELLALKFFFFFLRPAFLAEFGLSVSYTIVGLRYCDSKCDRKKGGANDCGDSVGGVNGNAKGLYGLCEPKYGELYDTVECWEGRGVVG